jgi:hypothetical protein
MLDFSNGCSPRLKRAKEGWATMRRRIYLDEYDKWVEIPDPPSVGERIENFCMKIVGAVVFALLVTYGLLPMAHDLVQYLITP